MEIKMKLSIFIFIVVFIIFCVGIGFTAGLLTSKIYFYEQGRMSMFNDMLLTDDNGYKHESIDIKPNEY
ncbi:MAG TPA: hypothetical protein VGB37_04040 [Candidatus Lokiarchaeia archaeon]